MIIYSDLHIYGAHPPIDVPLTYGPDIFYIGDNVDIKNCPLSQLPKAQRLLKTIEFQAGNNYIPGNHELAFGKHSFIQYQRVLLTHGDIFFWPESRVDRWRGGGIQPGTSMAFWRVLRIKNALINYCPLIIGPKVTNRIYNIATSPDYECHTVIIGHAHPQKILKKTLSKNNGPFVDLYVLPRGRHILDIKTN